MVRVGVWLGLGVLIGKIKEQLEWFLGSLKQIVPGHKQIEPEIKIESQHTYMKA